MDREDRTNSLAIVRGIQLIMPHATKPFSSGRPKPAPRSSK
jgi:hypothetical protein